MGAPLPVVSVRPALALAVTPRWAVAPRRGAVVCRQKTLLSGVHKFRLVGGRSVSLTLRTAGAGPGNRKLKN